MENILLGVKKITLGIVAALTATSSVASLPVKTPLPTPQAITHAENIIVRSGQYSQSGYTLNYTVRVSKDGGPITGEFSGVCTGPITGKFAGGNGEDIEGEAKANCKVAIFNYNLKANYTGKLYLNDGKVDINWLGEIPYTSNSGSFTVDFDHI